VLDEAHIKRFADEFDPQPFYPANGENDPLSS
jgi:hypothetical protein